MATASKSPERIIGELIWLYTGQTESERMAGATSKKNDIGFNAVDAPILSDMAKFYLSRGYLSPKQIDFVSAKISKYKKQIPADIDPLPIKKIEPAPTTKSSTTSIPTKTEYQAIKACSYSAKEKLISIFFQFPKNDIRFGRTLAFVKTLSGRKWDPDARRWTCPPSPQNIEDLIAEGFKVPAEISAINRPVEQSIIKTDLTVPGNWNCTLRPYQQAGAQFALDTDGRCLIADEMGLGKTVQSLAYLQFRTDLRPALVVCPATVKFNWERQINLFMPDEKVEILSTRKPKKLSGKKIYIINYDILDAWKKVISSDIKCIIVDECQALKNVKAKRTGAFHDIAKHSPHIIALSGTPIENKVIEFYSILSAINPDLTGSFWTFAHKYTNAKNNGFGWQFEGAKNWEELNSTLKKYVMIRRLKKDVLTDLPAKMRVVVPLEVTDEKPYNEAMKKFRSWKIKAELEEKSTGKKVTTAKAMVLLELLKQAAFQGKVASVIDWATDYIENNGKLILFAIHTEAVEILKAALSQFNPVTLTGSTPVKDRKNIVEKFQTDKCCKLLIGNIKAAGAGIDLTAANATAHVEFLFNPAWHDQAEDRVHRIGQTADSVFAYYLVAKETIDEVIIRLLDKKRIDVAKALDGIVLDEEDSLIAQLMEEIQ